MKKNPDVWTLTQAARLLGEPQHRLIYLCEKGAVVPDFHDAEGRGSSRRFSARNLLEFAIALRLRELEIGVALVGAVVHVLRAFEPRVGKEFRGFRLPDSLRVPGAPDLHLSARALDRDLSGKTTPRRDLVRRALEAPKEAVFCAWS